MSDVVYLKECASCLIQKSSIEFPKNKAKKDGLSCYCKQCNRIIQKKYRDNNKEKAREYHKTQMQENINGYRDKRLKYNKNYYIENKDKIKEYRKKYCVENKNKRLQTQKKYRDSNKEKESQYKKLYQNKNKKKLNDYAKKYIFNKRKNDPIFKLICNLRSRINGYCKRINVDKSFKTKNAIGCTRSQFKLYFESKFKEGMSWKNYGEWHVDHIKPISLANNEQEVIKLNHYTNLQPLWASENKRKSNKYE